MSGNQEPQSVEITETAIEQGSDVSLRLSLLQSLPVHRMLDVCTLSCSFLNLCSAEAVRPCD